MTTDILLLVCIDKVNLAKSKAMQGNGLFAGSYNGILCILCQKYQELYKNMILAFT